MMFDNSELGKTHRHLMTLERGRITNQKNDLPEWARQQYARDIEVYQGLTANENSASSAPENGSQRKDDL